jgi:hypothetical protein
LIFIKIDKIDNIRKSQQQTRTTGLKLLAHKISPPASIKLNVNEIHNSLRKKNNCNPTLNNRNFFMSVAELDRELLIRCLDEQPRAWEDFVDRFLGLVLHVVDHTATNRDVRISIEDRNTLCESVFAALGYDNYRLLRNFSERSSLTTYLSVVARRIVVRTLMNQTRNE